MTQEPHDPDLGRRVQALAGELPPVRRDLDAVRRRVGVRRRRRRVLAGGGLAAVVLVGGLGIGRLLDGDRPDTVQVAIDPDATTAPTSTEPDTAPTTSLALPAADGPPEIVVDEGPDAVLYGPDGEERFRVAPFPDPAYARAQAVGSSIVVMNEDGTQAALIDPTSGAVEVVDLERPVWTDLWSAGVVDGAITVVTDAYDPATSSSELIAVDLTDGSARTLATVEGGGWSTTSFTVDGRILVHEVLDADLNACPWELIDVTTGDRTPTPLPCLVEPAVGPDGTTVVDHGTTGVIRYDVATGAETGRWLDGVEVNAEGHQLAYDGRWVVSSNSYGDDDHGPYLLVDTETGDVRDLPSPGAASILRR